MSARICHITSAHRLHDPRILYKESAGLAAAGYEVHLLAPHDRDEELRGVRIHALPNRRSRSYRFLRQRRNILRRALRLQADLYHLHDPDLLPVGAALKRRLPEARIVFDVHEFIREQILNKRWLGPLPLRRLAAAAFKTYERRLLRAYDGVAVAVPDLKEEYREARHLAVIRNVPVLEMIDAGLQAKPGPRELTDAHTIYLIYPGTLSASRGVEQMVRLMEHLEERYRLRLIGRWNDRELFLRCTKMEGWRQVEYLGELRPEEVYGYLAASHIGLQLPLNTGNYQRGSLPVKVLEFMAAGLPVVLADQPSKRRTFGDHALYVDPQDPAQAAAQVRRLGESAELRKRYARSGRDFAEHNSWEQELQSLLSFYRELLA